jgi:hypothetical protein
MTEAGDVPEGEQGTTGNDVEMNVFYRPAEAASWEHNPGDRLKMEEDLETRHGLTTQELRRIGVADHIIAWSQVVQQEQGMEMDPRTAQLGVLRRRHEFDPDMAGHKRKPETGNELYIWSNKPGNNTRGKHTLSFNDHRWLGHIGGKTDPNDSSRLSGDVEAKLNGFIAQQPCIVTSN